MKKLFILYVVLTATTALWAQNNVITYTATTKLPEVAYASLSGGLHINAFDVQMVSHIFNTETKTGTITFNGNIGIIGDFAFYGCSSLTSITIPSSVIDVGHSAFEECNSLAKTNYIGTIADWCKIKFGGYTANPMYYSHNFYINDVEVKDFVIPNDITEIKDYAFCNCNSFAGALIIPNSVTKIGKFAFANCKGFSSAIIGNSVTTIEYAAFSDCSGLTGALIIPNSVTTIGSDAFFKCYGLTSVTIPNSVTTIGSYAFNHVNNIVYNGTATGSPWGAKCVNGYVDGYWVYSDNTKTELCGCSNAAIGEIAISNSVIAIGKEAFYGCYGLTSVTIPSSVTTIGKSAFSRVNNIVYDGTAAGSPWGAKCLNGYVDGYLVYNDASKTKLCGCSSAATSAITIPNSVTTIGDYAFYGCIGLTSITIPNSVTTIGDDAFYGCIGLKMVYNLSNLNITKGLTNNGYVAFYADKVYNGIPIGDFVIKNDTLLIEYLGKGGAVAIPNEITIIADSAFANCSTLTSVVIPNSVETIGESAFANCTYLTDVTIGANVKEIGCNAFAGDYRLENITCYAPITPNVCNTTFSGINKSAVYLYVPADYQRKYQVDPNWSGFSLHLIGAEQKPITGDEVTILPSTDNATFTWPANPSADGYSLEITKDGVVFCTLKFNAQGQLTGIAFAPSRGAAREMAAAEMTANGWQFTVTGLNQASKYGYTLDALNAGQQSIKHYEGEFYTDGYTGLDRFADSPTPRFTKIIKDNRLLILRNGKTYDAQGRKL